MRQFYEFLCIVLLFIQGYQTQGSSTTTPPAPTTLPDWWGDPSICTISQVTTPSPTPGPELPQFTNQAEFTLELAIKRHRFTSAPAYELALYHYVYDYDKNKLTLFENKNGTITTHYYDYEMLKIATYNMNDTCVASQIPVLNDIDGRSAIQDENGTWHIRPLNEFLLFSSVEPGREVRPVHTGTSRVRGIPVDQWRVCYVDRRTYFTELRVWSFAERDVRMPSGVVGTLAIPVQVIINGSIVNSDNTQRFEFDEVLNVLSYRPSLSIFTYQYTPPKGIYCDNTPVQDLVSLENVGVRWPFRFNVRVEALSSREATWQRFHLYYHQGDDESSGRLRYDYLPQGAEDYQSVIHDYTDNLTYVIDRRVGTCQITRGVEIPDVDPFIDPIKFFLKHETKFILNPPENAWENKGTRLCRSNSIECIVLTTTIDNFPALIEPDTGKPSGLTWQTTTMDYAWGRRFSNNRFPPNRTTPYDYPISLYLKMFRYEDPSNPSPSSIRTENVEYEFYEMSHDSNLNQFDISLCYRSLDYEYLHLVFKLNIQQGPSMDSYSINRRRLDDAVHYNLINRIQIRYARITDLEIDHESIGNDMTVFFTLLGRTPDPDSSSGFVEDEPTAEQANAILQNVINGGQFEFDVRLDDNTEIRFRAESGSLKTSKQYISTHAGGKQVVNQSYAAGSIALAVIVGVVGGIIVGILIAAIVRMVQKRQSTGSETRTAVENPIPTINFRTKQSTEPSSDV